MRLYSSTPALLLLCVAITLPWTASSPLAPPASRAPSADGQVRLHLLGCHLAAASSVRSCEAVQVAQQANRELSACRVRAARRSWASQQQAAAQLCH